MAAESDKTNTGVVATIVVVGAFSMISISALLAAMVRSEAAELDASRPMHADLQTVAELDRQQLANLEGAPRWIDKSGGRLAIPIERAMSLVVEEYRKNPASASPPPPPGLVMTASGAQLSAPADSAVAPALEAVAAGTVAPPLGTAAPGGAAPALGTAAAGSAAPVLAPSPAAPAAQGASQKL